MLEQTFPTIRGSPKMSSKLLSSIVGSKTDIKISLQSRRKVYSTLDRVQGVVTITPSADLPFDDIDIDFVGTSRTYVERLTTSAAVSGRSQAFHQFLRLSQPGVSDYYPEDGVLKAGQEYKIPFVFAIPQQLLPRVCSHGVYNDTVKDAHLHLPPSLGDCASDKYPDDFAPEMASIRYGVYAKISRDKWEDNLVKRVTVVAKARKIRIVPAVEELPPVNVDGNSDFTLRKERKLRKGLLKGKLGTLVMEAEQPSSFRLPAPDSSDASRTTTMATVLLRFDPAEPNAQPPRLNTMHSKLKVSTFYSSTARKTFPARGDALTEFSSGFHSEHLDLSTRCMANVEWTRVDADGSAPVQELRRSSSAAVAGPLVPPSASANYVKGPFYVARILVPVELPQNKSFPPTFHSCLISRTYALGLSLSVHSAPSLSGALDLRLPVQVTASPSLRHDGARPSVASSLGSDASLLESDEDNELGVDEFFEPRTISVPEDEYLGSSRLRSSDAGLEQQREQEPDRVDSQDGVRRDSGFAEHTGLPGYSLLAPGATRDRRIRVSAF